MEFVPYQFRPALKLIKSDEPRILIADSVGVGKTIEAGLIIKEMEARSELDNILIICPKPLVAERKWELEMKRFDEEFIPLDGAILRQVISDTHRDEEWPLRYNKAIIPYSILDSRVYEGTEYRHGKQYGLLDLDPAPHFDLVIIDEAHHIRNGSLDKEKAYAYKCVRYFCEHADAVVMLTATPLQTSDDDLFTLMNLLPYFCKRMSLQCGQFIQIKYVFRSIAVASAGDMLRKAFVQPSNIVLICIIKNEHTLCMQLSQQRTHFFSVPDRHKKAAFPFFAAAHQIKIVIYENIKLLHILPVIK